MVTRTEAAAATRAALLRAAAKLLDEGGPDAVTLRAVGARAGVSRGAPYGHFENKNHLLSRLAIGAWSDLADEVHALRAQPETAPGARLKQALLTFIEVGRRRPHLYALMFSTPAGDTETVEASGRVQDEFLATIAAVVGADGAPRYCALLMSCAHGIADMELNGLLSKKAWQVNAEQLVGMLIDSIQSGVDHAAVRS